MKAKGRGGEHPPGSMEWIWLVLLVPSTNSGLSTGFPVGDHFSTGSSTASLEKLALCISWFPGPFTWKHQVSVADLRAAVSTHWVLMSCHPEPSLRHPLLCPNIDSSRVPQAPLPFLVSPLHQGWPRAPGFHPCRCSLTVECGYLRHLMTIDGPLC